MQSTANFVGTNLLKIKISSKKKLLKPIVENLSEKELLNKNAVNKLLIELSRYQTNPP